MSNSSKAYSSNLQDKVKRLLMANSTLRSDLKAKDSYIIELEAKLTKLQAITQDNNYDYMFRSFLESALNDTL